VSELGRFLELAPTLASNVLDGAQRWAAQHGLSRYADPVVNDLRTNASASVRSLGGILAGWIGRLAGGIGQMFGYLLAPLLAFYLLADRDAVRDSLMRFMPERVHDALPRAEQALDRALKSYVRGQATVCAAMGVIVGAALASLGYPYALLLAVVVAVAEVLPVIGACLVCVAILFVGFSVSPGFALLGVGAYLVINWAVGAFVSPQLMSHHLKMHPFLVTVSVLAGASLLGAAGAMLALPAAAAIQAIVEEFARPRRKQLAGELE
jgi:predicted PurR-regulated permease PerM